MIIVDGNTRNEGIGTFANLEEVLNHIMQDESMENRIVTDVLVNNEIFSEIYPHQAEDITVDGISSVEVRSVPVSEMAVNMAGEMGKVARMMAHGARHVARLFRAAEDTEALELLQDLLDVTRDFMGMVSELRKNFTGGGLTDFMEKARNFPIFFPKWPTCWKTRTGFFWPIFCNTNSWTSARHGRPSASSCTGRLWNILRSNVAEKHHESGRISFGRSLVPGPSRNGCPCRRSL